MKKKLVIVAILVLAVLMLVSCRTKESTKNDSENQTTIDKNDTESDKVIVEDEVMVDFGTEQDNKADSDSKQDNKAESDSMQDNKIESDSMQDNKIEANIKKDSTTGGENSEASGTSVNGGTTDNNDVPNDSDTSLQTKPDNSDNESEEPENPYDKDGDGYVDGWY